MQTKVKNSFQNFRFGYLKDFNFRNFDIIIGAAPYESSKQLTQSIDFDFDDLTWCVKKADVFPPWRSFFLVATG